MKTADPCRFCRLYASFVPGFALPFGAAIALQFMLGLQKFGGGQYIPRVVVLSAVRSTAAAASGSALLLALVLWAHPLPIAEIQADLRRILARALMIAVPGYALSAVCAIAAGFAVAAGFGESWASVAAGFGIVAWRDLIVGVLGAVLDAALIVFLAWRFLVRLQTGRMSLPAKLIAVVTVTVGLRATVGLVLSTLLSA